jgi:flagellar biosynthesis component FlhA
MNRNEPLHLIKIALRAKDELTPESISTLSKKVEAYLTDLFEDLGIPGRFCLYLSSMDERTWLDAAPFHILINGSRCRTNWERTLGYHPSPQELSWVIVEEVYANRELLLSEAMLSALIESTEITCRGFTYDEACYAIRKSLRLGVAPAKVLQAAERSDDAQSPDACLEEALSSVFIPEVRVHVGEKELGLLREEKPSDSFGITLEDSVSLLREAFSMDGVLVGDVEFAIDAALEDPLYRFELNGVRHPPIQGLRQNQFLVNDTTERLKLIGVNGIPAISPANQTQLSIIETDETREICESVGLTSTNPRQHMILALGSFIRSNLGNIMNITQTEYALSALALGLPRLVKETKDVIPIEQLCLILRGLLEEGISIRNLQRILESVLDMYVECRDPSVGTCIENARAALSREIFQVVGRENNILCVIIDSHLEERLSTVREVPLTVDEEEGFRQGVGREIGFFASSAEKRILLVDRSVRRTVRRLTAIEFPQLSVLSYHELHPDLNIQPVGCVTLK